MDLGRRSALATMAVVAVGAALVVPALVVPALTDGDAGPPDVTPSPGTGEPALQKSAPPPLPFAFTTRQDGEPLPGNAWQVVVDPAVSLTVEAVETAPGSAGSVCELALLVETLGPGEPVSGELARRSGWTGGTRVLDLTWDGRTAAGEPAPPGTYRLVARYVEKSSCGAGGTVRGSGESSLGQVVVRGATPG